jgi:hypothetical protein
MRVALVPAQLRTASRQGPLQSPRLERAPYLSTRRLLQLQVGGVALQKRTQPHETGIFLPEGTAVLGNVKADQKTMQGTCGARLDGVPIPRCSRWSTQR